MPGEDMTNDSPVPVSEAAQLGCALDADAVFCFSCGQPDEPTLHDPARCPASGGVRDVLPIAGAVEVYDASCQMLPDLDDEARALHCAIVSAKDCATPAAPATGGVPDGWKLVPLIPTASMERVGSDYIAAEGYNHEARCVEAARAYTAMLAATPPIPEQAPASAGSASAREELKSALHDLHEGLTAALPETDKGWVLRRRFQLAEAAIERALAALAQPQDTAPEPVGSIDAIIADLKAVKPGRWKYHGYPSEDDALVKVPFGHLKALLAAAHRTEREAPYLEGHAEWAAPGDRQEDAWLLRFCDQDMREAIWTGPDAEREAWAAWDRYAPAWNCYVFRLARLTPPDRVAQSEMREALWRSLVRFQSPDGTWMQIGKTDFFAATAPATGAGESGAGVEERADG